MNKKLKRNGACVTYHRVSICPDRKYFKFWETEMNDIRSNKNSHPTQWFNPGSNWRPSVNTSVRQKS